MVFIMMRALLVIGTHLWIYVVTVMFMHHMRLGYLSMTKTNVVSLDVLQVEGKCLKCQLLCCLNLRGVRSYLMSDEE